MILHGDYGICPPRRSYFCKKGTVEKYTRWLFRTMVLWLQVGALIQLAEYGISELDGRLWFLMDTYERSRGSPGVLMGTEWSRPLEMQLSKYGMFEWYDALRP